MANSPAKVSNPKAADAAARANHAQWYAFRGIGRAYLVRSGSTASSDARASAAHGYPTIEEALANPNTIDAPSQLTITQWNEYASLPAGGGTLGLVETVNVTWNNATAQVSTPQNPATASATQSLFGLSANNNGFLRVAELILGITLIGVGVAHLTGHGDVIRRYM